MQWAENFWGLHQHPRIWGPERGSPLSLILCQVSPSVGSPVSRRSKLRLPNQSVPPRFPEPPRFADHGSVRRSAPFPALRRHEPAEDGEQDGRHGSDLAHKFHICCSGATSLSRRSLSTRSSPPCSATPRADAVVEAPRQSVSNVLTMGKGEPHPPRAHLTCAPHFFTASAKLPHDRCACTLTQPSLNHAWDDLDMSPCARGHVLAGDFRVVFDLLSGALRSCGATHPRRRYFRRERAL